MKLGPLGDRFEALGEKMESERAPKKTIFGVFMLVVVLLGRFYLDRHQRFELDGDCVRLYRYSYTAQDTAINDEVIPAGTPGVSCGQRRREVAGRRAGQN